LDRPIRSRIDARVKRRFLGFVAAVIVLGAALAAYALAEARRDPVVRRATLALVDWQENAHPVRVALLSDIHLGSRAMDAQRLTRIAEQVTALSPDLVLIAGDFVAGSGGAQGDEYAGPLLAPLSHLRAPLGVVAVLGNHDHWAATDAVRRALADAGITVLVNQALRAGPLAIGGVDDEYTGHQRPAETLAAAHRLGGATVVLSHAPNVARDLPAESLLMAGHTHCGQVVLPLWGPLVTHAFVTGQALFDPRYRCGLVRDGDRTLVVTAGLGTSDVPVRFGAPPDVWLLTLGPGAARQVSRPRP
jgi:predicted MPP superfamily phosphohydrolase